MKAAVLKAIGQIALEDRARPAVDDGAVLIKVEACAVCSTDVKIYRHGYSGLRPPLVLGHELAGSISAVGNGVRGWREGDRVAVNPNIACGQCWFCRHALPTACDSLSTIGVHMDGGFAEFVIVPSQAVQADCLRRIPTGVSCEEATLTDPVSCAVNAAELSSIQAGDTVVVVGAGPTGCMNVEVARSRGARVILVQRSLHRLEDAGFTAADVFLSPLREDVTARIKEETGGRGADVVIVSCNSPQAQLDALGMVRKRGNINFFGGLPKNSSCIALDSNVVHYAEISITGTHGGSSEHCRRALDLIASGNVKARKYITDNFPLDDVLDGLAHTEQRRALKVVIHP